MKRSFVCAAWIYGAGLRYPAKAPLQVYLDVTYFDEVGGSTTGSCSYLDTSADSRHPA